MREQGFGGILKALEEKELARIQDLARRVSQGVARLREELTQGCLASVGGTVSAVKEAAGALTEECEKLSGAIKSISFTQWCDTTYAEEFEAACRSIGLELRGRFPRYEVFPFEVRIVPERLCAEVHGKVVRTLAPAALAKVVKRERDRLYNARFDPQAFARSLLKAWDLLMAERRLAGGPSADVTGGQVKLKDIYQVLTLLPGVGKAYTERDFAFDLFRLRESGMMAFGGRSIILGHTRSSRGTIRVPERGGGFAHLGFLEVREGTGYE